MKNNYIDSLEKSLDVFKNKTENFDNIIKTIVKKIRSKDGRIIFLSSGQIGLMIDSSIKSFKYLFKILEEQFVVIISAKEYEETNKDEWKEFENNKSIGSISAIENNVCDKDIVIAFSATGKTNYVNSFLKESKEKGAFTSLITSTKSGGPFPFLDEEINLSIQKKLINGLYIGNHTTMLKIAFELIIFNVFEDLGQIYESNIMTTRIWTEKLKLVSIETIKKYNPKINEEEINKLIKETNGELSLILIMIKLKLNLKDAKHLLNEKNYNFKNIFKK